METTEKIVESYCRYVKGWLTLPNVKCEGQYEIDLLAIDPKSSKRPNRYHIESGVSISGSFSKLTAKPFSADDLKIELNLPNLTIDWVPVSLDERTSALQQGKIDLFCGADSVTLERRKDVSFSLPIFGDGIGAVVSSSSKAALRDALDRSGRAHDDR